MGSGASLTLPAEYESLSEGEKKSFNKKFEDLVTGGSTPEAAMAKLFRETLEFIATLDPKANTERDVTGAIEKLRQMDALEAVTKFTCAPGGKVEVLLTDMPHAVDAAVASGLTPLVVDHKGNADTFYSYNSVMIDSKKMGLDRSMKKVPLKDLMEEARQKLVGTVGTALCVCSLYLCSACQCECPVVQRVSVLNPLPPPPLLGALKFSNIVVIAMTKAVTDFNGVFTDESEEAQKPENELDFTDGRMYFPRAVLERAGRDLVQDKYLSGLYRTEDKEPQSNISVCRDPDAFRVIITTMFEPDDFEGFLFDNEWGLPKPKENYAFIVIKNGPAEDS